MAQEGSRKGFQLLEPALTVTFKQIFGMELRAHSRKHLRKKLDSIIMTSNKPLLPIPPKKIRFEN